jgi:hypothetical protein
MFGIRAFAGAPARKAPITDYSNGIGARIGHFWASEGSLPILNRGVQDANLRLERGPQINTLILFVSRGVLLKLTKVSHITPP